MMSQLKCIILSFVAVVVYSCNSAEDVMQAQKRRDDSIGQVLIQEEEQGRLKCREKIDSSLNAKGLFAAYCSGDEGGHPPVCSFKKYPFDTLIEQVRDTLQYSFRVSAVCCKSYYGNYFMNADTLVLFYSSCGHECDCHCDYRLTYKIPLKQVQYKYVVLRTDQFFQENTK